MGVAALRRRLLDRDSPLEQRLHAARALGERAGEEALSALWLALAADLPKALRAAVAEGLGRADRERAGELLAALLDEGDEVALRAALRGVASSARPEAAPLLAGLLLDPAVPDSARIQAAVSLGGLDDPLAYPSLVRAFAEAESDELAAASLEGLARLPDSRTGEFFRAVLEDPDLSLELKASALETLGSSGADAADLLLEYAGGAAEPALRVAALRGASLLDGAEGIRRPLLVLLESEESAEVRAELYQLLAFAPDETWTQARAEPLMERILAETDSGARLEGFRLVASLLRAQGDPSLADAFDREMVPWLEAEARNADDRYTRMVSVDALRLAATPAASRALHELSRSAEGDVRRAAEEALRSARSGARPSGG